MCAIRHFILGVSTFVGFVFILLRQKTFLCILSHFVCLPPFSGEEGGPGGEYLIKAAFYMFHCDREVENGVNRQGRIRYTKNLFF